LLKYIYRLKGSKLCYSKKNINIEIFNLVSNKLSNKAYRLFTVSKNLVPIKAHETLFILIRIIRLNFYIKLNTVQQQIRNSVMSHE